MLPSLLSADVCSEMQSGRQSENKSKKSQPEQLGVGSKSVQVCVEGLVQDSLWFFAEAEQSDVQT